MSNLYINSIFKLLLIKEIFDKNKSLRLATKRWTQFWPKTTPDQEFCFYSDLKDNTMERRKRRVIILSTSMPELEFYNGNGRWSFLAIEIHIVNSDPNSHLF